MALGSLVRGGMREVLGSLVRDRRLEALYVRGECWEALGVRGERKKALGSLGRGWIIRGEGGGTWLACQRWKEGGT